MPLFSLVGYAGPEAILQSLAVLLTWLPVQQQLENGLCGYLDSLVRVPWTGDYIQQFEQSFRFACLHGWAVQCAPDPVRFVGWTPKPSRTAN